MGLDVTGVTVAVYALSRFLTATVDLIVPGRLAACSAEAGSGLELPAIAAAVLGGTSLFGGPGSIGGTLVAALILSVIFNGLIPIGLSFSYRLLVTDVGLGLAVAVNELPSRDVAYCPATTGRPRPGSPSSTLTGRVGRTSLG